MARARASLLVLIATSIAWSGATSGVRADETRLAVWHHMGDREAAALERVIRAFERAHPDLQVDTLSLPFAAYASKIESDVPASRGPDLFIDSHERFRRYLDAHVLDELTAPPLAIATLDHEWANVLVFEGRRYALPLSLKTSVFVVNMRLLREAPRTIEGFRDVSALGANTTAFAFEPENPYYLAAFVHATGGALIRDDGAYAFVGPEAERAVEHARSMIRAGLIPEAATSDLVTRLFAGGRAATALIGTWALAEIPEQVPVEIAPLPTLEGRPLRPYATIEAIYLARGSRDRILAAELAVAIATGSGARTRELAGEITCDRVAWAETTDARTLAVRAAVTTATPMSTHPHMHLVFEPAIRALRKIFRGGHHIPSALAEGSRRFDDIVRPEPAPRDPTLALIAMGLALMVAVIAAIRRARDPAMRAAIVRSVPAYRWILHAWVVVGALVVAPLLLGAATSFFAGRGRDLHYAGFANYVDILTARGGELFASGSFWVVLVVTVLWTVVNVAIHVAIGIALALLLSDPMMKLRGVYRMLLILPWAVPTYVTALAWRGLFHRQFGAVTALLRALGVEPIDWFGQFATAFAANVTTNAWLGFPFMMVVALSALAAIPRDLYEAAAVDGATRWERFRLITWPLLLPSMGPAIALGLLWTFNLFNVVFLVSAGEPDGSTEILVSDAYRWAFTRSQRYGYGAAYAVLIFGILALSAKLVAPLAKNEEQTPRRGHA